MHAHYTMIPNQPTEKVLHEMQRAIRESAGMSPSNVLRNVYAAVIAHASDNRK